MSTPTASPMTDEGLEFESLTTDRERFEYSQYIVNTPPKDRPELTEDNAKAALSWAEDNL
jgi:hypothetical protein